MAAPRLVGASQSGVAEAVQAGLAGASAVDWVVAGVFAAAALSPSVLLGPVQLLVGGAGAGLRAIDGRTLQPGMGAPRPRGYLPTDRVPDAARVGVPALVPALALAHATFGRKTFSQTLGPAVELAAAVPERRALLRAVARRGPTALSTLTVAEELVRAAGRVAGGLLTEDDLAAVLPVIGACSLHTLAVHRWATIPWGAEAVRDCAAQAPNSASTEVVFAADPHGLVAIACYEQPSEGVPIAELGLVAPLTAAPVLRGVTRVRPGVRREASAPIALGERDGFCELALGLTRTAFAEARLAEVLSAVAVAATLDEAIVALRNGDDEAPRSSGIVAGLARSRSHVRLLADVRGI